MQKRYTIQMSVHEVYEDGDTADQEIAGVTLDYASYDAERLAGSMSYFFTMANEFMELQYTHYEDPNITMRRLEDEEGWEEDAE